jgi:Xaa-Pro aminopeptidase
MYEIVYEANQAATAQAAAGNHWNDPHETAVKVVTKGLRSLGLLNGRLPTLIKDGAYRDFFMHRTGHWLGIDVHDVGDYKVDEQWRLLEPGMSMTIEPGIYVAPNAGGRAKAWRGTGIRIEDDVVVTRKGPRVLTTGIPTTIDEVEAFMASA